MGARSKSVTLGLPYELRIGVTGHRHLKHPEAVAAAVERLLDSIQQTLDEATARPGVANPPRDWRDRLDRVLVAVTRFFWPSLPRSPGVTPVERRTPIHWTVVSALARGADRIVARCVLARKDAALEPVLPMPLDDYKRDFDEPGDLAEFMGLYGQRSVDPILGEEYARGPVGTGGEDLAGAARNDAYFKGGTAVIERCEILIAVWDGQPADGHGGTGDVVASALRRGRAVYWIDTANPTNPIKVLTRKPGVKNAEIPPGSIPPYDESDLPSSAKELSPNFHQLSAYNRDPACDETGHRSCLERHAKDLRDRGREAGVNPEQIDTIVTTVLPYYARADELANRYQALHRRAGVVLHGAAALAVTIAIGQLLFFPHRLGLIWLEVAAMLVAVALLRVSRSENWHHKWLLDRQLAEQLRSAQFTALMGRPILGPFQEKPTVLDATLPFYHGPEGWVIEVAARVERAARREVRQETDLNVLREFMAEAWIGSQAAWHATNARKKQRDLHRAHRAGLALFSLTLLMAGLHALGVGHRVGGHGHASVFWWALVITALTVALPAWGAAVHAVSGLREHERIATRSERMSEVLAGIAQEAREATDEAELREVVARAQRIMALENHEWLVSLSFRGPVMPA